LRIVAVSLSFFSTGTSRSSSSADVEALEDAAVLSFLGHPDQTGRDQAPQLVANFVDRLVNRPRYLGRAGGSLVDRGDDR
jgi:hypothetical protein